MITQTNYYSSIFRISGTKEHIGSGYNPACLVVVRAIPEMEEIGRTTTDAKGYFEFNLERNKLRQGEYRIEFFGSGYVLSEEGIGKDWETIHYFDNGVGVYLAHIITLDGNSFKYIGGAYSPSTITLKCEVQNVIDPSFTWYIGNNQTPVQGPASDELANRYEVIPANIFIGTDVNTITCVVNGIGIDGKNILPISDTVSISKINDGQPGPGLTYQGEYNQTKKYYGDSVRSDLVVYNNAVYRCIKTTSNPAGQWPGEGEYWEFFATEYDSFATGLLLAHDATITRVLVMGEANGNNGVIRSVEASAVDTGDGFYIAATPNNDLRKGLFRVGSFNAVNTHDLEKGILWDGTDLTIISSYFKLSSDGKLWAAQGGFGGSADSPLVTINNKGFNIQSIGYFTGESKFWNKTFDQLKMGPEDIRGYDITIPNGNFELQTDWTLDQNTGDSDTGYFIFNTNQYYRLCAKGPGGTTRISSSVINADTDVGILKTYDVELKFRSDFNTTYKNVGGLKIYECDEFGGNRNLLFNKQFCANVVTLFTVINLQFDTVANNLVFEFYSTCESGANSDVQMILDIDYVKLTKWEPFVEISEKGIYIFKSPSSLVKAGIDTFQIKGGNLEVENITIKGTLSIMGQANIISPAHQHISDAILEGTTNLFFTTARSRAAINNTYPILYNSTTGNISLDYDTTNLNLTNNKLNTIQNISTTSDVQFKTVTAESFNITNGNSIGIIYNEVYIAGDDIPSSVPIVIPNSRSYIMNSNKLLVFVDGRLQVKGQDYFETSTTTISFNYDLAAGATISFIIIGW
jgi:hypothetical protein